MDKVAKRTGRFFVQLIAISLIIAVPVYVISPALAIVLIPLGFVTTVYALLSEIQLMVEEDIVEDVAV